VRALTAVSMSVMQEMPRGLRSRLYVTPSPPKSSAVNIGGDQFYVMHCIPLGCMNILLPMARKPKKSPARGRPPLPADQTMTQLAVRFPKPMLATIDKIIAGRLDEPDRSTIIRELLAEALAARRARERK
jgi:hypothetical protein